MVSLILPVYKTPIFTEAALLSLASRTVGDDCELVVILNSSSKRLEKRIEQLQSRFSSLLVEVEEENLGPSSSYNRGAELSNGDILVLLASDLVFPEYWLERLLEIKQDPTIGVLSALSWSITGAATPLSYQLFRRFQAWKEKKKWKTAKSYLEALDDFYEGGYENFCEMIWRQYGTRVIDGFSQAPMISKSLFEEIGGFDPQLDSGYQRSQMETCEKCRGSGFLLLEG